MISFSTLQNIPLIDTHAHRIHPNRAPKLSQICCYIPGKGQEIHARNTLLYGVIIERLRKWLGMANEASWEEIEAERDRQYQADPAGYFSRMIQDKNVLMYCMENGSPLFCPAYSPEEISYFNASIPLKRQSNIVRIERMIDDMMPKALPFSEFLACFLKEFPEQIQREKAVAIKSCVAYYGGLDISFPTEQEAARAYENLRMKRGTPADTKNLYHFILMLGIDIAAEFHLPVQIHTGEGAGRFVDYRTINPIYLHRFLLDPRVYERVKIVLLHGGHPYEEDASNLTLQFENVYTDFSGAVWFSCSDGENRLRALMERAPLDKIMYGSDATMLPELYWYSPDRFRLLLGNVLNRLIESELLTESRALDTAHMIMYQNALRCYDQIRLKSAAFEEGKN